MSAVIDKELFARQMVVIDKLLSNPDYVALISFKANGWPHEVLNVREALLGLRNLGDEIQDQLNDGTGVVVLEDV
jgi:hypothetical protein